MSSDTLKAATRSQRVSNQLSIHHLRPSTATLDDNVYDKDSILSTTVGKALASTYVTANAHSLRLDRAHYVILDIDSQFTMEGCHWDKMSAQCTFDVYAIPLRCMFPASGNKPPPISHIDGERHQCKGEAGMAQVDWLTRSLAELKKSSSMASFVTSDDIDAVYKHMCMVVLWWPRDPTRTFVH